MIYIGIDPGKSGAMALMDGGQVYARVFDEAAYLEILRNLSERPEPAVCCLEKVSAHPGEGVTSCFKFGANFGWIQGVLMAYGIPYQLVTPQKWKNAFGLDHCKEKSVLACQRLFPGLTLLATPRCRKPHDGMAEAVLMAEYARRNF